MQQFIEHISADQYWFNGFFVDQTLNARRPFVASGTFLNNSGLLMFEGTYRLAQTETSHQVTAKVLSWGFQSVVAEISSVHIGKLRGYWHFTGATFEFLASSPTGTAASCHIKLANPHDLHVSGSIQRSGTSMGFAAEGGPGQEREHLSNVVSIVATRRAWAK